MLLLHYVVPHLQNTEFAISPVVLEQFANAENRHAFCALKQNSPVLTGSHDVFPQVHEAELREIPKLLEHGG